MGSPNSSFEWFTKARSRLWVKDRRDLSAIPRLPLIVGTFFFTGLSPVSSGTVGSFAAAIVYLALPSLQNPVALLIGCAVVLFAGIWSGGIIERILGIPDPGIVVIDEVLGQWVALLTLSYAGDLRFVALAFFFFRAFDILKPQPARYFERKPGGTGIMLDDAVAGIYANILAHIVMHFVVAS